MTNSVIETARRQRFAPTNSWLVIVVTKVVDNPVRTHWLTEPLQRIAKNKKNIALKNKMINLYMGFLIQHFQTIWTVVAGCLTRTFANIYWTRNGSSRRHRSIYVYELFEWLPHQGIWFWVNSMPRIVSSNEETSSKTIWQQVTLKNKTRKSKHKENRKNCKLTSVFFTKSDMLTTLPNLEWKETERRHVTMCEMVRDYSMAEVRRCQRDAKMFCLG